MNKEKVLRYLLELKEHISYLSNFSFKNYEPGKGDIEKSPYFHMGQAEVLTNFIIEEIVK